MDRSLVFRGGLAVAVLVLAGCTTRVEIAQGRWMATCQDVRVAVCQEVAEVFVNNLARNEESLRLEVKGVVVVSPLEACPDLPDWAVGPCWRAAAPATSARACMIIAGHKAPAPVLTFGQVGGDEYTGRAGAPRPGTTPC